MCDDDGDEECCNLVSRISRNDPTLLSADFSDVHDEFFINGQFSCMKGNTHVTTLKIHNRNMDLDLEPIRGNETITDLDIWGWSDHVYNTDVMGTLKNLRRLSVARFLENLEMIKDLQYMEYLNLEYNKFTSGWTNDILGFTNLRELDISTNDVSNENMETLRRITNNLKVFEAYNCGISDISFLRGNESITSLNLSENLFENIEPLRFNSSIIELDLLGNRIRDISPINTMTALRTLIIELEFIRNPKLLFENIYITKLHTGSAVFDEELDNALTYYFTYYNEYNDLYRHISLFRLLYDLIDL